LDGGKRDIIDGLITTKGTKVNWRMIEMVIVEVRKLNMFVEQYDAGDYDVGRAFGFLRALIFYLFQIHVHDLYVY
jgi:hypothetical protein